MSESPDAIRKRNMAAVRPERLCAKTNDGSGIGTARAGRRAPGGTRWARTHGPRVPPGALLPARAVPMPDPSFVFAQSLSGLTAAMCLFLIASWLSLIFRVLRVLDFAHGPFYLLGASSPS